MQKIGIGITTRNRPDILDVTLSNFRMYLPNHCEIIVINDGEIDCCDMVKKYGFNYIKNETRLGVAKSKNICLRNLEENEYIFLFDDDCHPISNDWANYIINCHLISKIHHFNYIPYNSAGLHAAINRFIIQNEIFTIHKYAYGVMLFVTKEVLNKVGGLNPDYGLFGEEHIGYSYRIYNAGLTNNIGPIISLQNLPIFFHAYDFKNFNHKSSITSLDKDNFKNRAKNTAILLEFEKANALYVPYK